MKRLQAGTAAELDALRVARSTGQWPGVPNCFVRFCGYSIGGF